MGGMWRGGLRTNKRFFGVLGFLNMFNLIHFILIYNPYKLEA